MAKISFAGWKDPVRRPRYIIWVGVSVLVLAAVMILALGATSSYWFCANVCHKVQDDSIIAYNRSTHNKVSCMACHMPVNANPVIFILHKAEALGELYLTVLNKYELPLNPHNHVSLVMTSGQCTQCHSENRDVTTTQGILIDHEVHAEKEVECSYCHNRVAHREDFELTLSNPDGEPSHKHYDFMTMDACFRCHMLSEDGLERPVKAPGTCTACHPANFQFKPASHLEEGFYPGKHGEMAKEVASETAEVKREREEVAAESEGGHGGETLGLELPWVGEVNYCFTCHVEETFCNGCHGMEMPHPDEFKEPENPDDPTGHPVISKQKPDKCELCHQPAKTFFCETCHHGEKVGWEYNTTVPWQNQHAQAVGKTGLKPCTDQCHTAKFCSDCHTKLKPLPSSHKDPKWLHNELTVTIPGKSAAKASAVHATSAQTNIENCAICHGEGGPNGPFCTACHKTEMPHPDQFKQFHAKTGKSSPAMCQNCHQFREICSNCHHIDSSTKTAWINAHGPSVAKNKADGCVEKCHKKEDCVACHTSRNVVPASHKARGFTKRPAADQPAGHTTAYEQNAQSCTFCHGDGGPNAPFCAGCHKIEMPHKIDEGSTQKFPHKDEFASKKYTKAICANCHTQFFCDNCHHKGASPTQPWLKVHPNVVKQDGAEPCFECHQETFCSYCHVRLNR